MHLQRAFINELARRQDLIKQAIHQRMVEQNHYALGKKEKLGTPLRNVRYAFATDGAKLKDFSTWLQSQLDSGVLGIVGSTDPDMPPGALYISSAYKQGLVRAYLDSHKADYVNDPDFYSKSEASFLRDSFASPEALSKVEALYTRTFEEMKGLVASEKQVLGRVLANGMSNGSGAADIARDMTDQIDGMTRTRGMTIARTEIVRAHAQGQLAAFEDLGIQELGIEAEWSTADDDVVCPDCDEASSEGPYTLEEADGLIPLHPNCRCAWIPVPAEPDNKTPTAADRIAEAARQGAASSDSEEEDDEPTSNELVITITSE